MITGRLPAGVCPVLATPFTPKGAIDTEGFARIVDHMMDVDGNGVMFPGIASEYQKLNNEETQILKSIMFDRVTRRQNKSIAIVLSVSEHSTSAAIKRAHEAIDMGASAVSVLPTNSQLSSPRQMRDHLVGVMAATEPTAVILQLTQEVSRRISASDVASLAQRHPNLQAVKVEALQTGRWISELLQQTPALPSLVGKAGLHLPDSLRRGATGVMPGCSFVEVYLDFWRLWTSGSEDQAEQLHRRMLAYLCSWMENQELLIQVEKVILNERGFIQSPHCRAPTYRLDPFEMETVDRFLNEFEAYLPCS